jgi:acetyl-CoA carboxylase/biotin carboxylase 1
MPSYEERAVQMESILKASVSASHYGEQTYDISYVSARSFLLSIFINEFRGVYFCRNPNPDVLKELTDSRYSVYDVLPTFFHHDEPWIVLGMLFSCRNIVV